MTDSSKTKLTQTTMGNYFTRAAKEKEKKEEEAPKINRRTRFSKTTTDDDWETGWSSSWNSGWSTDWKKKDTEDYRNGYPGKKDRKNANENLKFYKNEIKSYPDGDFIENIHKKWWGNYTLLERHHGYIQWLFPIRESGMNFHAQELQLHEAENIKADPEAHRRVLKSYEMMLDFYGMTLKDKNTGEIVKAKNWRERFAHLNKSYHNYLRITRILKCLGELGYEHLKYNFLAFVLEEALETKSLKNCASSCKDYWVETLRGDEERKQIKEYINKVEDGYESEGDPVDKFHGNSNDEMMDEDSQEMKHYKEEKNDTEEKVPKLDNQMSIDDTLNDEENKQNKDKSCDLNEFDNEMASKQNKTESEMDSKQTNEMDVQTNIEKSLSRKDISKTSGTESQETQSYDLKQI